MALDRIMYRKNDTTNSSSTDTSDDMFSPFVLYAPQPVTPMTFTAEDMMFKNVNCKKATEADQNKVDHYIKRIVQMAKDH